MANLRNSIVTNAGAEALTAAIVEGSPITFSKAVTSQVSYSDNQIPLLTTVNGIKQSTTQLATVRNGNKITVVSSFLSENNPDGYQFFTTALYITINGIETLFAVSSSDMPSYVPSMSGEYAGVMYVINFAIVINGTENFTIEASYSGYVSREELKQYDFFTITAEDFENWNNKIDKVENAVVGNIPTLTADKQIEDSGKSFTTTMQGFISDDLIPTSLAVNNAIDLAISGTGKYQGSFGYYGTKAQIEARIPTNDFTADDIMTNPDLLSGIFLGDGTGGFTAGIVYKNTYSDGTWDGGDEVIGGQNSGDWAFIRLLLVYPSGSTFYGGQITLKKDETNPPRFDVDPNTQFELDGISINLNSKGEVQVADNAITSAKIKDNGVTSTKIASESITSEKIANESVEVKHISSEAKQYLGRYNITHKIPNSYFSDKFVNDTFTLPLSEFQGKIPENMGVGDIVDRVSVYDGTGYIGVVTGWDVGGAVGGGEHTAVITVISIPVNAPDNKTINLTADKKLQVPDGGITFEKLDSGVNYKLSGATGTYPINSSYFAGKTIGSTFYLLPAVLPIPTNLDINKYVYKVVVYDSTGYVGVITSYDAYLGFVVTIFSVPANTVYDGTSINVNASGKLQIASGGIKDTHINTDTVKYLGRYTGAYEISNSYFSGKSINSTFILPFAAVSSYGIDNLGANNSINKIIFYDGTGYIGVVSSWDAAGYVVKIISISSGNGGRYLGEFYYSPTGDTRPTNAAEKDWIRLVSSGGGVSTYLYQQWDGTQWVDMLNDVFCSIFDLAVNNDKLNLLGFTGKKSTASPSVLASIDLSELGGGGGSIPIWSTNQISTGLNWKGSSERLQSFSGTVSLTTNTVSETILTSDSFATIHRVEGVITIGVNQYLIGRPIYSGTALKFSSWVEKVGANIKLCVIYNSTVSNVPYEVSVYIH